MMEERYSVRCTDLTTFWNRDARKCVPCPAMLGYEAPPNCGFDDDGGRHVPYTRCRVGTFSDGSSAMCKPCTTCLPQYKVSSECTSTTNTRCQLTRTLTTEVPFTSGSAVMATTYSGKCPDVKTHWDKVAGKCLPCPILTGYEAPPNCGFDDDGGRHVAYTECKVNTFNDGSSAMCKPCTTCPPQYKVTSECTSTTNTQCQLTRPLTTEVPFTISQGITSTPRATISPNYRLNLSWAVPLASILIMFVLSACIIYTKRKRGQHMVYKHNKISSVNKEGLSPLFSPDGNSEMENMLSPNILSAPLQTVLDNLDVLEELVILLDPESHGVKNTKHLASHCSFPSTWITYTYSMKDSKSPLKAVLDGVTSSHPDWTVGHLAKLLRLIERNDAVAVLAKLRLKPIVI